MARRPIPAERELLDHIGCDMIVKRSCLDREKAGVRDCRDDALRNPSGCTGVPDRRHWTLQEVVGERGDGLAHKGYRTQEAARIREREATDRREALQSLIRVLLTRDPGAARIRRWTQDIGRLLLLASPYAREPNFTRIHPEDLAVLFAAYDKRFLDGLCKELLGPQGVTFRLSSRMTRAVGKTTRILGPDGTSHFEIAVATSILFDGFQASDSEVTVCGLPCAHRLEALQRLFEHELVHLAEWLSWDESHCGRKRFQGIAARLFGHRAHTHQLVTRSARAAELGFTVGARVKFRYQGRWLNGRVNRITKRATVLVDDPAGELMSDGRRYVRYYVPLGELCRG